MNLWIDDIRMHPEGWDHAYTSAQAIQMILDNPTYEWISFDHDLGLLPYNKETGRCDEDTVRRVIKSLWVYGDRVDKLPANISVHSDNLPGKEWILGTFQSISRHVQPVKIVPYPAYPKPKKR